MSIILAIVAGYVAVNLLIGKGTDWNAITLYWCLVTVKYIGDIWKEGDE